MLRTLTVVGMSTIGLLFVDASHVRAQLEFGVPARLEPNVNSDAAR